MKLSHLVALAAFSLPFSALAEYSYSYAEVGHRYSELSEQEGNGFDIEVNFLLGDLFFVSLDADEVEYDSDLNLDRFGLGLGIHFNVFSNIDLYAVASYEDLEFDIPSAADFDDKGWGAEIGARYALNEQWEFAAAGDFARYEGDATDIESNYFIGTAVYNLSNNYAIVGEYLGGEIEFNATNKSLSEDSLRIALRIQF